MAKNILVIDDDLGILEGFQAMLESAGYCVRLSSDASESLMDKNNTLPDLILLDVLLSGHDGRDICKLLKSNDQTKHIPVIMMSAAPNIENTIKEARADDFLKKPFEMDELLSIVEKYVGKTD